jgi:predicted dehydrogenase
VTDRGSGGVVRVGVVGLGYWGPNLVRNVVDSPRAELAWLCDRSRALLGSRRYPLCSGPSTSEMLADPSRRGARRDPHFTHHGVASAARRQARLDQAIRLVSAGDQ